MSPRGRSTTRALGSLVAKELESEDAELPGFVSIAPNRCSTRRRSARLPRAAVRAAGRRRDGPRGGDEAGGIGRVGTEGRRPGAARRGRSPEQADARLGLLDDLTRDFLAGHPEFGVAEPSLGLRPGGAADAFPGRPGLQSRRRAGGAARRLRPQPVRPGLPAGPPAGRARGAVRRGRAVAEPTGARRSAWDTHQQNFDSVQKLCGVLDPGWATLIEDLQARGLLDTTLIVWMGEFGRTPKINNNAGRDHFPAAWTTVLAGGGIKGGQAIGRTSADGNDGRGSARRRPRPHGHDLQGAGDRPVEAEPLGRRPSDPDRRPRPPGRSRRPSHDLRTSPTRPGHGPGMPPRARSGAGICRRRP